MGTVSVPYISSVQRTVSSFAIETEAIANPYRIAHFFNIRALRGNKGRAPAHQVRAFKVCKQ